MTAHGLLGATVRVGPAAVGAVTGVLVDADHAPVLLRVRLFATGGIAFVPPAALDLSPGGLHARSANVLLEQGEASFYEERALTWLPTDDDVSDLAGTGMVTAGDDRQRNRLLRNVHA